MNGHRPFTAEEIRRAKQVLNLTPEDVMEIFFAPDVAETEA
jgi:hypothetical protein